MDFPPPLGAPVAPEEKPTFVRFNVDYDTCIEVEFEDDCQDRREQFIRELFRAKCFKSTYNEGDSKEFKVLNTDNSVTLSKTSLFNNQTEDY
jgi:hypothetical protein